MAKIANDTTFGEKKKKSDENSSFPIPAIWLDIFLELGATFREHQQQEANCANDEK